MLGYGSGHFLIGGEGGHNFLGHTPLKKKIKCRDPYNLEARSCFLWKISKTAKLSHMRASGYWAGCRLVWCHVWWLGRLRSWLRWRAWTTKRLSLLEASFWYVIGPSGGSMTRKRNRLPLFLLFLSSRNMCVIPRMCHANCVEDKKNRDADFECRETARIVSPSWQSMWNI